MATIVVRHDRPPMRRERLDLTAVAHQRLMLMLLLLAAVSALLVIRLAWMGISSGKQGEHNGALAGLPSRADIVDRNGVPLANPQVEGSVMPGPRSRRAGAQAA